MPPLPSLSQPIPGLAFLLLSVRCPHDTSSQSTSPPVPRAEFKKCVPVLAPPVTLMRNVQCSSTAIGQRGTECTAHTSAPPLTRVPWPPDPPHHHRLQSTASLPRLSSRGAFHDLVGRQMPAPTAVSLCHLEPFFRHSARFAPGDSDRWLRRSHPHYRAHS